jgi:small subunit ribosomal protein S16
VADERIPRDGRTIEEIGHYGPKLNPPLVEINRERALHWLLQGAQPSDTVRSLFSRAGVMAAFNEARKARKASLQSAI